MLGARGWGGDGLVAMEFHVGATDTFWDQTDMVAGGQRIVHIKMLNFMYVGFTTNFFFFLSNIYCGRFKWVERPELVVQVLLVIIQEILL